MPLVAAAAAATRRMAWPRCAPNDSLYPPPLPTDPPPSSSLSLSRNGRTSIDLSRFSRDVEYGNLFDFQGEIERSIWANGRRREEEKEKLHFREEFWIKVKLSGEGETRTREFDYFI